MVLASSRLPARRMSVHACQCARVFVFPPVYAGKSHLVSSSPTRATKRPQGWHRGHPIRVRKMNSRTAPRHTYPIQVVSSEQGAERCRLSLERVSAYRALRVCCTPWSRSREDPSSCSKMAWGFVETHRSRAHMRRRRVRFLCSFSFALAHLVRILDQWVGATETVFGEV